MVTNLCRDNGIDVNAIKIKQETHGLLPKNAEGIEFDIDQMKIDLKNQRDYELQPGEVVVGRGLDEALKIKEYETN